MASPFPSALLLLVSMNVKATPAASAVAEYNDQSTVALAQEDADSFEIVPDDDDAAVLPVQQPAPAPADALQPPPPAAAPAPPNEPAKVRAEGVRPSEAAGESPSRGHSATRKALLEAEKAQASVPTTGATDEVHLRNRAVNNRMFGSYRIRVGASRPNFDDGLKGYKELYGTPRAFPMLSADWFPFDWYATLGICMKLGYYAADGYATQPVGKKKPEDFTAGELVQDKNGTLSLTLIPFQIAAAAEFTPFERKWVVVDAWVGIEKLYWQEVRTQPEAVTSTTTPTPTTTAPATGTGKSNDTSSDALTNKGTKTASTLGFAVNILLNPLDEETVKSSRGTLGVESVYLSPYMQIVRTVDKKGVSFGRSEMGLAFTFETAR